MMTIAQNLTALGAALTLSAAAAAQAAPRSAGHWEGKIHMGANEVPRARERRAAELSAAEGIRRTMGRRDRHRRKAAACRARAREPRLTARVTT